MNRRKSEYFTFQKALKIVDLLLDGVRLNKKNLSSILNISERQAKRIIKEMILVSYELKKIKINSNKGTPGRYSGPTEIWTP